MHVFQIHVKMEVHAYLMNQQDLFVVIAQVDIQDVLVIFVSFFFLMYYLVTYWIKI